MEETRKEIKKMNCTLTSRQTNFFLLLHVTPFNPWFLKVFSLSQYVRKLYCKVGWFGEFLVHRNGMHCVHTTFKSHMVNVDETKSFFYSVVVCAVNLDDHIDWFGTISLFHKIEQEKEAIKLTKKNRYLKVVMELYLTIPPCK